MLESRAPNHWWELGDPLICKVANVVTTPISMSKGIPLATVYSVNSFGIPRIQSLLKPFPQSHAEDERITLNILERQTNSRESTQQDNLNFANLGQLSPSEKEALIKVLKEYADVFAANPKAVATCRGPSVRLELKDPNSAPCVAPIRH